MRHSLSRLFALGLLLGLSGLWAGPEHPLREMDSALAAATSVHSAGFPSGGWTEAERLGHKVGSRTALDGSPGGDGQSGGPVESFGRSAGLWASVARPPAARAPEVWSGFGARLLGLRAAPANAPPQS